MGKGDFRELTIPDAAKQLAVHEETLRGWIRKGLIKIRRDRLRPGRPTYIAQEELTRFSREMQGLPPADE